MRGMVRIALNHIATFMGLGPFQASHTPSTVKTKNRRADVAIVQLITNYITAMSDNTRFKEKAGVGDPN
jgi:hypothetical protein